MVSCRMPGCTNSAEKNSNITTLVTIKRMLYNYIAAYSQP